MLTLRELLLGIQASETRQMPQIPPLCEQIHFSGAAIDSREVTPNTLFVALPGERTDGHLYLSNAVGRGARGALVQRAKLGELNLDPSWVVCSPDGHGLDQSAATAPLLVVVDDPLIALQRLASYHRQLFTPTVIGITGSVGKTSTKEVAAAVLGQRYRTLKNPRSYNNEATLPISLLQLAATDQVAVLEMGCYGPGDIALLAGIARPQIGIVTNVGPSHLERMGSMEVIAQTKAELVQALPDHGWALLNKDDLRVQSMQPLTNAQTLFYGFDPTADLWADAFESLGLAGIRFQAHYQGQTVWLQAPLLGRHSVYTALAASAAGLVLGMTWDDIQAGLLDSSAAARMLTVPGQAGTTLIDDSYNASPVSSLAALALLAELDGRKVVVHGDMYELGHIEEEAHRQVGTQVASMADFLLTVGPRARWIAAAAREAGLATTKMMSVDDNATAIDVLRHHIQAGDYVLIKGSRGMAMEQIVNALRQTT
jgi:UDP-N-acetylmuramoyl-tripeptide--D-alanyl-D-alanine ligase